MTMGFSSAAEPLTRPAPSAKTALCGTDNPLRFKEKFMEAVARSGTLPKSEMRWCSERKQSILGTESNDCRTLAQKEAPSETVL